MKSDVPPPPPRVNATGGGVLNYEPFCMLILIYVKLPRGTSRGRTCDRFLAGLLLLFLSKEKYCLRSVYMYNKRQNKIFE